MKLVVEVVAPSATPDGNHENLFQLPVAVAEGGYHANV